MIKQDKNFMKIAIKEAKENVKQGDYPIGAVIVKNGKILATGRSTVKQNNDPTSHAEIDAIRKAAEKTGYPYLEDCVLYTTPEPCVMCAAASVWAKLKGIVYGASMEDAVSLFTIGVKCRDVLAKSETKLELIEEFEREKCVKLFESGR